ncbi:putative RING-H2 finger protein ATL71 isoform X1 [Macadamia integrifolia]|uniref:putative RING-H2 finger protein ATL71 isoform X1 n=1 Tax=Macadamia integrifolia TaxID=60698 RepID=UPI001C4EA103|nr:putative RING-H2 finger protein ATL71 isoform X1 [Macadamia integrifolia]
MITPGINLVMTVIGFAVSTMFIVFVCTRLICARIQLSASRRSFPTASRSDLSVLERGLHGLEPVVVATFPTKKFSDNFFASGEDSQLKEKEKGKQKKLGRRDFLLQHQRCTVCLAEYQEKDVIRVLPYCGHYFHVTCIDVWLRQHSTCPVCRISLRDSPERKRVMQPMTSSAIRPTFGMDSLDSHSYHCLYTSHAHSSRPMDGQRMEPIQEDQFASKVDAVAAEGISASLNEDNQVPKVSGPYKSEIKHFESPSNP